MKVTLETERFVLRPPTMADVAPIAKYLNNFAVAGNLSRVPFPYHPVDARAWLGSVRSDAPAGQTGFAIDWPGEGYIGQVGYHADPRGPVLGYWLAEPFWGKGIMTEAVAAVLAWYFAVTDAPKIFSGVFAFNAASLAVQKKFGFVETATNTMHCLARNQVVRHIDTELSRTAWTGTKP
ncbi:MAG: Ribosomal-protein-S5p-alanine acetyltransferase [Hyphomicrobiales bacterium]|nr:Ribosomal-protein-S5p-alanine acetyltransferase [Hyphomicrobiales bacterium]